jgi:hypothetical protein
MQPSSLAMLPSYAATTASDASSVFSSTEREDLPGTKAQVEGSAFCAGGGMRSTLTGLRPSWSSGAPTLQPVRPPLWRPE